MAFPLPLPMRRALDLGREAAAAGEVPTVEGEEAEGEEGEAAEGGSEE